MQSHEPSDPSRPPLQPYRKPLQVTPSNQLAAHTISVPSQPASHGARAGLRLLCLPPSRRIRAPPRHRRLEVGSVHNLGGGGGAVRVLRHLLQPHQLPHRPARGEHGRRRRRRQRVVRRRVDAAAARRRRRRLLAGPVPHHRRLLRALHHGPRHADALLHVLIAWEPTMRHLRRRPARLPAVLPPEGLLLRLALPGGHRAERPQALRAGLRRRPVRRDRPQRVIVAELLLQLVVLRDLRERDRHRRGHELRPGQRQLGAWLRRAVHDHAARARRLPARRQDVPVLRLKRRQWRQLVLAGRRSCQGVAQEVAGGWRLLGRARRLRGERRARGGGEGPGEAFPHMGNVLALRRRVRAATDAVHEAGGDAGQKGRVVVVPGTTRGAAVLLGRERHRLHRAVRPRPGARGAQDHRRGLRHHHAPANRHGLGPGTGCSLGRGAGRDEAAECGKRRRRGGSARRGGADEPVVDRAAVRAPGRGGCVRHGRDAGVLLRPDARRAEEPRPRALPERPGRRQLHQQLPHLGHRRRDEERRRDELVRRQPQPGASRLLLPGPCRAHHAGAYCLPLLLSNLRLQKKACQCPLIQGSMYYAATENSNSNKNRDHRYPYGKNFM